MRSGVVAWSNCCWCPGMQRMRGSMAIRVVDGLDGDAGDRG
jgi:hypothetical protein